MKKVSIARFLFAAALICCGVFSVLWYVNSPKLIRNKNTIRWLETTNDLLYSAVKEELKEIIIADTGDTPIKVAFKVYGGNYQTCTYNLDIWYKTESGDWYLMSMSWFDKRISNKLDEMLMNIYRS